MSPTRWKDLTEKEKRAIFDIDQDLSKSFDEKSSILTSRFSVTERTISNWRRNVRKEYLGNEDFEYTLPKKHDIEWKHTSGRKRFIVTWAQNATPLHTPFWRNIQAYAKHIDADIAVIQGRYRNPTSVWTRVDQKYDFWTVDDDYLMGNRYLLHQDLQILGDVKIQPTAVTPLQGIMELSGQDSAIVGHPRVHMEPVPTLPGYHKKVVYTTGACTVKNYIPGKSGKKGEFHHTLGFVIVELDEEFTHIRQVTADDKTGKFHDIHYVVDNGVVGIETTCKGYILSDLHLTTCSMDLLRKSVNFTNILLPETTVGHDLLDFSSKTHHDDKDPFKQHEKYITGRSNVEWEVQKTFDIIRQVGLDKLNPCFVDSNHDRHIDKWLATKPDWSKDLENARYHNYLTGIKLNGKAPDGILAYLLRKEFPKSATYVPIGQPLRIAGFECGMHGDIGSKGSRGSINQFKRYSTKTITGHSHTPMRKDGALSVGFMGDEDDLEYVQGANNILCMNVVVHNDGRAQHILFRKETDRITTLFD